MSKTDTVSLAAQKIAAATAAITEVTAPGFIDEANMPTVKFDRLGVERRVLGHITTEVNVEALGPRNTLHALVFDLMGDPNTTRPPAPNGRLDVEGKGVAEIAGDVLAILERLQAEGLVSEQDGVYALTAEGVGELQAGGVPAEVVPDTTLDTAVDAPIRE